GQRAGGRQLPGRLDIVGGHAARFAEAGQQVYVLNAAILLDDVLEQEGARLGVGSIAVPRRAPAGELRDVLVVLADPRSELGAGQLAVDPLLGERVHPAVAGVDGRLELSAERTHVFRHGRLLVAR